MDKKRDVKAEIERRILERDRLLARAQQARRRSAEVAAVEPAVSPELRSLRERLATLEAGLAHLADPQWVATSSLEELVRYARALLEGSAGDLPAEPAVGARRVPRG